MLGHGFDVSPYFLGEGQFRPLLTNLPTKNNSRVFCPGHVNTENYLREANLHISASTAEGMPKPVLETLAAGIPYILSSIPEHLEFSHFENKIISYFELDRPPNEMEISSAVDSISNRSLGDFEDFKERFSHITTAKSYLSSYTNILVKRASSEN